MTLEEFEMRWREQDRRLEQSLRLNRELLRETVLGRVRSVLWIQYLVLGLELAGGLLAVVFLANFVVRHYAEPAYALPAAALHLATMAYLYGTGRQLDALLRIDYAGPIASIQQRLETSRRARLHTELWALLAAPLYGFLALMVLLRALGGHPYGWFPGAWVAGNVAFGVVFLAAGGWLARRFGARETGPAWVRGLLRELSGVRIAETSERLRELAEFEREPESDEAPPPGA